MFTREEDLFRYKAGENMDKNDCIGIIGFLSFSIGTYLVNPAVMFLLCGLLCMGVAVMGARKGVNKK